MKDQKLTEIHVEMSGLRCPVVIYVHGGREEAAVRFLEDAMRSIRFSTEDVVSWCEAHGMEYRIVKRLDLWRGLGR